MAPSWIPDQKGVNVQIVDVFALQLATGYEKDPAGRLLLQSDPSVSAGRTWSLAKACQLVRNDANPHRWVVLHRHKKAWGLFWVGGGLEQCRELLQGLACKESVSAIVPATPESLLRLILELDDSNDDLLLAKPNKNVLKNRSLQASEPCGSSFPWRPVLLTSMAWLIPMALSIGLLISHINRQEAQLIRLLDRVQLSKP
jgi:hypothetical protein